MRRPKQNSPLFPALAGAAPAALTPSFQRVAAFVDQNRLEALTMSAAEMGEATGTSDATVIRAVQALGFTGLPELRRVLRAALESGGSPADNMRRTFSDIESGAESAVDLVLATHLDAVAGLRAGAGRAQISMAVALLSRAQRIVAFGLGPSAHLARYASHSLLRNGRATAVLDAGGKAHADQLLTLRDGDALLMLAYGRAYAEAGAAIAEARRLQLPIVLLTDSLEGKLARHADVIVPVRRGQAERVALHGATFVCLEAIALGIAASDTARSMEGLKRLGGLRRLVAGGWSAALGTADED
ncbi:MAG TPA: MurR/RpiR family transcriptional regulator [Roseomonas sp.]